jgi:hypothetical protein
MFLGACTNEPEIGVVSICNHSGRTLRFDFTSPNAPDSAPAYPVRPGTLEKPGWGIIRYQIWSMRYRRFLPEGVTGLVVRDSATGYTVRIPRRKLMETEVWAQGASSSWHIRAEPDGDRFRIAEQTCEREGWDERDRNAAQ